MPAEGGRVSLIHRLGSGGKIIVSHVNLQCEAVVIGLFGEVTAACDLFRLFFTTLMLFNVVKKTQILESRGFNFVPFALCLLQLLISELQKLLDLAIASLAIKSLYMN